MNRFVKISLLLFCAFALPVALLAVPPGSDQEITERIKASGNLCKAGEPCAAPPPVMANAGPRSGQEIYNQHCFACHTTGASDAPMLGDGAVWGIREGKGIETLYTNSINGLGLMPPRGTCVNCSDDELNAAVDYILDQSR